MHPSIHYRFNEDDEFSENQVILAIILWQTLAACLISLRSHVLCGGKYVAVGSQQQPMHLNFPGLCLWNMILLVAVDMLVLPPIFAFTQYFYYYYQIQQAHA